MSDEQKTDLEQVFQSYVSRDRDMVGEWSVEFGRLTGKQPRPDQVIGFVNARLDLATVAIKALMQTLVERDKAHEALLDEIERVVSESEDGQRPEGTVN